MPTTADLAARFSAIIALQQDVLAAASGEEAELLNLIVRKTAAIASGGGAIVQLLYDQDLVFRAVSGPLEHFVGAHIATEQSLSGICIRDREVLRSDDSASDPRADAEAVRDMEIGSMVVAPLLDHERAIGVLTVYAKRSHAFEDLDVYVLRLIAGLTSSALMLARELRERRTSEERYRMLFEKNVAGVFRTALDGTILDCNDALVHEFGYASRQELMRLKASDLYLVPSSREHLLESLLQQGSMTNVHVSLKRNDGSPFHGLMNISIIPAEGGEVQLLGTLVEE
ncbi:MAG: GAF domain-containing protein [Thermoanaerobaculia bacterium]